MQRFATGRAGCGRLELRPPAGEPVTVWVVSLAQPRSLVSTLSEYLSADECARAARFLYDVHRDRFIVCHAVLRGLLAYHTGVDARSLQFAGGKHGKPHLATGVGLPVDVEFNLSASSELALIAITGGRRVGVDVEHRRHIDVTTLAVPGTFTEREREHLSTFDCAQRERVALQYWTVKEAYVKALGEGLSRRLDSFETQLIPNGRAYIEDPVRGRADAADWTVVTFAPRRGYIGAAVASGTDPAFIVRDLDLLCEESTTQRAMDIRRRSDKSDGLEWRPGVRLAHPFSSLEFIGGDEQGGAI